MGTDPDFSQRFKQRLVFESSKVEHPFKFIGELLSKGLLSDGSNDSDGNFGLKEWMVQFATTIVCSKGADAIGGLLEALEVSGNQQLISSLRTWTTEDFWIVTDDELSEPKKVDPVVQTSTSEMLPKPATERIELSSSGSKFLETAEVRIKNYPVAIKSLANERIKEQTKIVKSSFFNQPAPSNGLEKVATFNCQLDSSFKGTVALEFDREKMLACFADCTVKVWNWREGEEKKIKFDVQVKNVTCYQFDDVILILGTSEGAVYLLDARNLEEKWSIRFSDPVHSLKFVKSTLVILTRGADGGNIWWVEISRTEMRLLKRRLVLPSCGRDEHGFYVDRDYSFFYSSRSIEIYLTESGKKIIQRGGCSSVTCSLKPPASVSLLKRVDLISTTSNAIAGCKNGLIVTWSEFDWPNREPYKILKGHTDAIVGLCAVNGHLLSLDQGGKLLMWSGYDLENKDITTLVARNLAANFVNVTSLVAHERWFASSSEDGIINIWTLPDLWLRTG